MFRRRIRIRIRLVALAAAALLLVGCGSNPRSDGSDSGEPAPGLSGELAIFAAASLTASFAELAEVFGAANPNVTVNPIVFDGSSTLATQINEGAPAGVFASADQANMGKIADQIDGSSAVFANNTLQIAVAPGNPLGIRGPSDLASGDIQVVLCAPEVPCGTASNELLELARVTVVPVSEEQNVKAVLTKVRAGEADAGLVYVTDVTAAVGVVDGVGIDGAARAANAYPIAVLEDAADTKIARAFVDFVLSAEGLAILAKFGFAAP